MYTESHVVILHFNQDTKQSSVTCKNAEKPPGYFVSYRSINIV